MRTKKFYTIDSDGLVELRDLEREGKHFTFEKFVNDTISRKGRVALRNS